MSRSHGPGLWTRLAAPCGRGSTGPRAGLTVAVLHQAIPPPVLDGAVKPANPRGYRDSAADIVAALVSDAVPVVTPAPVPSADDRDFSFPDTEAGIASALEAGARVLWCNTTVFGEHPLAGLARRHRLWLVAQPFALVERYEDKSRCHTLLSGQGLAVPHQVRFPVPTDGEAFAARLDRCLDEAAIEYPVVVKPCRGRGSEGVTVAAGRDEAVAVILGLATETTPNPPGPPLPRYGRVVLLEEYLPGPEWTVTVLPPGRYEGVGEIPVHWALPPVARHGHRRGVVPYSGQVPIERNSAAVTGPLPDQLDRILGTCESAAAALGVTTAVRMDCRSDAHGTGRVFDVNFKPNMTGPARPGREGARNLCGLAAEAVGWRFEDLVVALLGTARPWEDLLARTQEDG